MTDVAIIGLGRMGRAMALRLAEADWTATVWNRTAARAEELARTDGVHAVATPREAASSPIVVCSLADDAALEATYHGADGLLAGLALGTVVLETSTVDPETVRTLASEVAATGAALLDAPVSGSVPAVQQGILTFMVGGPEDGVQRAQPVLDILGKRTFHLGEVGTGAAMKLAVNAIVHALNVTLSESLVLAERAGISRQDAYEVIAASAAGAPFVGYKQAAFLDPEGTPTAFSLELVAKDLQLIADLAHRLNVPAAQVATNLDLASSVTAEGYGARDMSWLAEVLRRRADRA